MLLVSSKAGRENRLAVALSMRFVTLSSKAYFFVILFLFTILSYIFVYLFFILYRGYVMDSASLIKDKDNNSNKKIQKFDVNKLNSLFDSSNSETTNHTHLIDPVNTYNFYEQYLEIQSTNH